MGQRWESLCRRCGLCCHEKRFRGAQAVIDFNKPCRYLASDASCSVYATRLRTCPECSRLTIFHAIFTSWLPDTCGYVVAFRPWRSRKRVIIP